MWILNYLPNWIFHLVVFLGVVAIVAAYLIRHIPFTRVYALPLNIGGAIAICVGLWVEGSLYTESVWQERVKELEAKLAVAEQQSKEANDKIVSLIAAKDQAIKARNETLLQYVEVEVTKYDNQCKIPEEFIFVINKAAEPLQ